MTPIYSSAAQNFINIFKAGSFWYCFSFLCSHM